MRFKRLRDGAGVAWSADSGAPEMSRLGARMRPKTLLGSLAPFVAMVQSTDSRQRHDLRRG